MTVSKTSKSQSSHKGNPSTRSTRSGSSDLQQAKGLMTMAELLASSGSKIPVLRRGQEVTGKVISISKEEIIIDIGAKSEGIVFGREFASVRDLVSNLSPQDSIDAIVIYPENEAGQVVLSLRKLSGEKRWTELEDKKSKGEVIDVIAQEVNRGGIICDWLGLRGFLPASQLSHSDSTRSLQADSTRSLQADSTRSLQADSTRSLQADLQQGHAPSNMSNLIGKSLKVKVIEVDRTTNRLIFSQRQPDETSLKNLQKALSKVQIGQTYQGIVSAVLPFGLFVEIEVDGSVGLEGLVHISEISWEKVEEVGKLFKVGDKVDVAVVAKDQSSARLNLSIKQLIKDPFLEVSKQYSKDQIVTGSVERVTPYGIFVTLENGLEGMVHISKVPPNESWQVGKEVQCSIESVDTLNRKITLVPVTREKPILYR